MVTSEYVVVTATSLESLINQVNTGLSLGWKPQGGMFRCGTISMYYQAMVKESNDD